MVQRTPPGPAPVVTILRRPSRGVLPTRGATTIRRRSQNHNNSKTQPPLARSSSSLHGDAHAGGGDDPSGSVLLVSASVWGPVGFEPGSGSAMMMGSDGAMISGLLPIGQTFSFWSVFLFSFFPVQWIVPGSFGSDLEDALLKVSVCVSVGVTYN